MKEPLGIITKTLKVRLEQVIKGKKNQTCPYYSNFGARKNVEESAEDFRLLSLTQLVTRIIIKTRIFHNGKHSSVIYP